MTQVFVSYARSDEATARRVANALQSAGYDIWWDSHLPAHRAYSEIIERNLKEAKAAVVLWSQAAAQSQWVRAEADLARSEGKLIQARLDDTMPPLPFNQIQCTDLKGWRGSTKHPGWVKLQQSVAALVSGEDAPLPVSEPPLRWWQQAQTRWAALGILLVLLAAFLVMRFTGGETGRPVVAVLPFESLDKRDESLVAGIWEDTRQAISRNPQLLVLGPNTSEEIAKEGSDAAGRLADYLV
ncbi:MAG TPA: TIR domain-containing protein, partial [Sphingomicrobium sp.]|nr:TIR domain-containing protein [Sphingomicrobium sp.]